MEFAIGAMGMLLPKLGELLLEEYNLNMHLEKGIKELMDELLVMQQAALVKVSDMPLDQLDPSVKTWANDVRELSYAIEDNLDSFMVRLEGLEPTKTHTFLGFIKEACSKITKLKVRREIASSIKDVKIQVKEVKERYDRYKDVIGNTSAPTEVDPRLFSLYSKVPNHVGIDEAINELTKRLSKIDDASQQKDNTVSIVGFGGLGKTTLAKAVYDNLKKRFDCGGFVPVGRNPDKKKLLRDILHELDNQKYKFATESKMDEKQLINELRQFLADKRYLIVIDDIWDASTWEMIKCGLVDSNGGNIVITTTRSHKVAERIGGVYNMKPLSDVNSKRLFRSRIFGGEIRSPDDDSDELFNMIVTKCGGVPLSIITLASVLVSRPREAWYKVFDSIGFGDEDNDTVQNTRKILSFSYYDLPFHLKTCLLHLCVYPEYYWISKNSVIWQWVAEGFIPIKPGMGAFEVGQSYYNDLIDRCMIKSVRRDILSWVDGCRVHDIVLDITRTISREVNFISIQDKVQYSACSASTSRNARRLAIHDGRIEHMDMVHVRSFYATRIVDDVLPPVSSFKVLRVLALENCMFLVSSRGFENLGKLVHLRYLGLEGTPVTELPDDIGHDLKFLQTLNTKWTRIKELPSSVGELTRLMCLRASKGTIMSNMIGKLTCLEELELDHVDKSPDFTMELGKLTQLRVLSICFDEMDESAHKALVKSVRNLRKVQDIMIVYERHQLLGVDDDEVEEWGAVSELRRFVLTDMIFSRRPSWVDPARVPHLSHLWLTVHALEAGDLQILGRLPSLRVLYLSSHDTTLSYTVGSHEFQNLAYLITNTEIVCGEGALPMLEELDCHASAGKDVGLVGNMNMPLLQKISYKLDCDGLSHEEVQAAEAALRQAAETHPKRPYLEIQRRSYECEQQEEEEEEHISEEKPSRGAVASWEMLEELARTVVVLTMGQSSVRAENLQDYFSSMFSRVLINPVIPDLLFKLGSQSGLEYTLDFWRTATERCEGKFIDYVLQTAGQSGSFGDNLSDKMQKMMPVVSQVLAELPPLESTLQPPASSSAVTKKRRRDYFD